MFNPIEPSTTVKLTQSLKRGGVTQSGSQGEHCAYCVICAFCLSFLLLFSFKTIRLFFLPNFQTFRNRKQRGADSLERKKKPSEFLLGTSESFLAAKFCFAPLAGISGDAAGQIQHNSHVIGSEFIATLYT
jgi:hypothetical protein